MNETLWDETSHLVLHVQLSSSSPSCYQVRLLSPLYRGENNCPEMGNDLPKVTQPVKISAQSCWPRCSLKHNRTSTWGSGEERGRPGLSPRMEQVVNMTSRFEGPGLGEPD